MYRPVTAPLRGPFPAALLFQTTPILSRDAVKSSFLGQDVIVARDPPLLSPCFIDPITRTAVKSISPVAPVAFWMLMRALLARLTASREQFVQR